MRILRADLANAPRPVARTEKAVGLHRDPLTSDFDPARVFAVLGHAREVEERARSDPAGIARLLDRARAAGEQEVGADAVRRIVDSDAKPPQRLDDLDRDRSRLRIHALHAQAARRPHVVLSPGVDQGEGGVDDVQMGIDAHGDGEELLAIAGVPVEEVSIVEVPIPSPRRRWVRASDGSGSRRPSSACATQ